MKKAKELSWTTEQRRVRDLLPLGYNPRILTPERREKLEASLEKFNLVEIPVINTDGTVIAGNQRLDVLMAVGRGDETIDVRVPSRTLTEREVKEYNITSNTHVGIWDTAVLEEVFSDIDLGSLGLMPEDISAHMSDNSLDSTKKEAEDDNYEIPDEIKTDIVRGDLFEIGTHRLLCGDSTSADDVEKLMYRQLADLYLTDPPYGVKYADKNRFLNAISPGNRIQKPIENDGLDTEGCGQLWHDVFVLAETVMTNKASYYIFSAQGQDLMMMMMMIDKVFSLKHCLIWVKNNHVLGRSDYNYKHEPFLYGWKKKGTHEFFGGFQTSVFEFPKPQKSDLHPTMKPVTLISKLVENSTRPEGLIYDSFLGSGTTMVAAHQLNRRCYGMEIDPKYCQVILERMLRLDPTLEVKRNGEPYNPPTQ